MPHECANCSRVYEDGSQSILEGCECGGKKFQFRASMPEENPPQSNAIDNIVDREDSDSTRKLGSEGNAQHDARTDLVDKSELPKHEREDVDWAGEKLQQDPESPDSEQDASDDPYQKEFEDQQQKENLDEIRRELSSQFGSVKILEPGQYELDLWEMYERDEYIIALQEDGQYMIEVPYHLDDYDGAE